MYINMIFISMHSANNRITWIICWLSQWSVCLLTKKTKKAFPLIITNYLSPLSSRKEVSILTKPERNEGDMIESKEMEIRKCEQGCQWQKRGEVEAVSPSEDEDAPGAAGMQQPVGAFSHKWSLYDIFSCRITALEDWIRTPRD